MSTTSHETQSATFNSTTTGGEFNSTNSTEAFSNTGHHSQCGNLSKIIHGAHNYSTFDLTHNYQPLMYSLNLAVAIMCLTIFLVVAFTSDLIFMRRSSNKEFTTVKHIDRKKKKKNEMSSSTEEKSAKTQASIEVLDTNSLQESVSPVARWLRLRDHSMAPHANSVSRTSYQTTEIEKTVRTSEISFLLKPKKSAARSQRPSVYSSMFGSEKSKYKEAKMKSDASTREYK